MSSYSLITVFKNSNDFHLLNFIYFVDPNEAFAHEVAEKNSRLKEQTGVKLMEISSDENYKIESEVKKKKKGGGVSKSK